jgi:hypothetical protein
MTARWIYVKEGALMPLYLVESKLPEITMERLEEVLRVMVDISEELTDAGKSVHLVRATFLPGDSRCFCLVEATDPAFAIEASERAQIPYERIANAFEVLP